MFYNWTEERRGEDSLHSLWETKLGKILVLLLAPITSCIEFRLM